MDQGPAALEAVELTSMATAGVEGPFDTKVMMEREPEPELLAPVVPLTELLEAASVEEVVRAPIVWAHCYAVAVLLLLLLVPATGVSNFLSTPPSHWPWEEPHTDLGTLGAGVSDWEIRHANHTLTPWSPPPSRPPKSLIASHQHREAHRAPPMSSA
jgi:hypothetical protein